MNEGSRPDDAGPTTAGPSSFPCPGCGAVMSYASPRYPERFWPTCTKTAVDGRGRPLEFANASMSGGFVWRYWGEAWHELDQAVLCLIRGVPAKVQEARFGGVVAEPFHPGADPAEANAFGGRERVADLR